MLLLKPYQLTIITTNQCTAKCAHCCMNSSPDRGEKLNFEQIKNTVDSLHSLNPLEVVIFTGGEPTLLGEELLEAIAYVDSLGISTRLVTNAFWAVTPGKASRMVNMLRESGLREINFSIDDYHLPYISFETVQNAWIASKNVGFQSVVIANSFGKRSLITPQYIMDRLDEKLPLRFDNDGNPLPLPNPSSDGTLYMLSNSTMQKIGRFHEELDNNDLTYPDTQDYLNLGCPWVLKTVALSPKNHLVSCCGIEAEDNKVLDFGDVSKIAASDLIRFGDNQVIINAISFFGLIYLKNFIQKRNPDILFRQKYASICEICEHILTRAECMEVLHKNISELAVNLLTVRQSVIEEIRTQKSENCVNN